MKLESIASSTLGTVTFLTLAMALATGCNTSTEGAAGNVLFTPDDCGRVGGCDFGDALGVGGTAQVQISGVGDFSTAGIDLASDAPEILQVTKIPDVAGRPAWEIFGTGEGIAHLAAVDPGGVEVDFIEFDVLQPARLTVEVFSGNAVGPFDDPNYDERWTVNANEQNIFLLTPLASDDEPIMGVYQYVPFVEVAEFDDYINNTDNLNRGTLDFTAPAGNYGLQFSVPDSNINYSILIEVAQTN